ncbi:hypothetical protein [Neolewinella persica]|uniref:hypothetical protein n=1 Tax=Neolewinella persica TaxID=70998 RepID=UPI00036A0DC8|nr:hypothetical protein [Neolewinella persica]
MDAPQSDRFREMQRTNKQIAQKAVRSSIAGRRRSWLERVFEFAGKRYRVVSLGEAVPATLPKPSTES